MCDAVCVYVCVQNDRGITALGVAVGFNQAEVVAALLVKGANIEFQDPAGNTVLHYAAGGSDSRSTNCGNVNCLYA